MAIEGKIKNGLKKGSGRKLHTHAVRYERADNGGIHAKVERHTSEGHHHTEDHVLADADDAAAHLQEHMGDQPAMGEGQPPEEAPGPEAEMGGGAMMGGGA